MPTLMQRFKRRLTNYLRRVLIELAQYLALFAGTLFLATSSGRPKLAALLFLVGMVVLIYRNASRTWYKRQMRLIPGKPSAKAIGNAGETAVFRHLVSRLPDSFRVYRNLRIPNAQSRTGTTEIDLLAVGDSGAFCIEVKTYRGVIHVSDDPKWLVNNANQQYSMRNPARQATSQKLALQEWLGRNGISVPVYPIVAFAGQAQLVFDSAPSIPIYQSIEDMVTDMLELPVAPGGAENKRRIIEVISGLSKVRPAPKAFRRSLGSAATCS